MSSKEAVEREISSTIRKKNKHKKINTTNSQEVDEDEDEDEDDTTAEHGPIETPSLTFPIRSIRDLFPRRGPSG